MRIQFLTLAFSLICLNASAEALADKKSSAEILATATAEDWRQIPSDDLLIFQLERGQIAIALSPVLAQNHVAQVKKLARDGFYDGLSFYRVIEGFVAQGGDPFNERELKSAEAVMVAEFEEDVDGAFLSAFFRHADPDGYAAEVGFIGTLPVGYDPEAGHAWHLHCAGAFAFGRENEKDTASTEFYITLQPQRYLDRNLSVFGRVIDGMEHVQALRRVDPPASKEDDLGEAILSVRVASDISVETRPAFEILDSARPVFAEYVEARRNRPEEFFWFRPDHLDVCQLPIPVRSISSAAETAK